MNESQLFQTTNLKVFPVTLAVLSESMTLYFAIVSVITQTFVLFWKISLYFHELLCYFANIDVISSAWDL